MEITPCLGIGDLLILKRLTTSKQINIKKLHISRKLIETYRKYPDKYQIFIERLIKCLFPNVEYDIVNTDYTPLVMNKYSIESPYIYDETALIKGRKHPRLYHNYIVFHTKVRMERMDTFMKKDLPILKELFKTFKVSSHQTILILGERTIEECFEKQTLNIVSLYQDMLSLSNNNKVIDLTKEELYSGNPDFDDFTREIDLIHHAKLNVTFGIGGNTNLCYAFSLRTVALVGPLHECKHILSNYKHAYHTIEPFVKKLKDFL